MNFDNSTALWIANNHEAFFASCTVTALLGASMVGFYANQKRILWANVTFWSVLFLPIITVGIWVDLTLTEKISTGAWLVSGMGLVMVGAAIIPLFYQPPYLRGSR